MKIIKPAIENAGFDSYRVDSNLLSQSIILEIFEAIQECPIAVCDLSSRNPNVLYELGLRQAYDKPEVLIKGEITPSIFDVGGLNTHEYNSKRLYENVINGREKLTTAIIATKESNDDSKSLIKIINTMNAINEIDTVSNEDKTSLMLSSILSTMEESKKREQISK